MVILNIYIFVTRSAINSGSSRLGNRLICCNCTKNVQNTRFSTEKAGWSNNHSSFLLCDISYREYRLHLIMCVKLIFHYRPFLLLQTSPQEHPPAMKKSWEMKIIEHVTY